MTDKRFDANDTGALRESLHTPYFRQVPLEAIAAGAAALEYGAIKYDNRNWEKGLPWQQLIDSLSRHVADFERGRDYDDGEGGSGLHQVCMIMACSMMLSSSVMRGIGNDNRLPMVGSEAMTAKECAEWIKDHLERSNIGEYESDG